MVAGYFAFLKTLFLRMPISLEVQSQFVLSITK